MHFKATKTKEKRSRTENGSTEVVTCKGVACMPTLKHHEISPERHFLSSIFGEEPHQACEPQSQTGQLQLQPTLNKGLTLAYMLYHLQTYNPMSRDPVKEKNSL